MLLLHFRLRLKKRNQKKLKRQRRLHQLLKRYATKHHFCTFGNVIFATQETAKCTFISFQTCPDEQHPSSDSGNGTEAHQASPMSEHCRLYFGALQKAIGGFVGSVRDGQPPEKFISQSKLVIMVGQRLVDTLCREAQREKPNQTLLCKSNHLCALLKQLAVATKKAALHFPDKQALCEAQEFAKELAQRAQHFRISLDI